MVLVNYPLTKKTVLACLQKLNYKWLVCYLQLLALQGIEMALFLEVLFKKFRETLKKAS